MATKPPTRPPTPQALLHRAPNKPDPTDPHTTKPNKYIILLLAPTSVAGKIQIATSVSQSLSCPLFQGDSLHESSAKAAAVGARGRSDDGGRARYQRMWLSKMTRTGLLFPGESRPANEGFAGFGGGSGSGSTSTSRRGSGSSVSSAFDGNDGGSVAGSAGSLSSSATDVSTLSGVVGMSQYINRPVVAISSEDEARRRLNPALMVLTHPELEAWHKDAIRQATGEYGIGIIFVPLFKSNVEDEDELPVLKPLDPSMVSGFTSFDAIREGVDEGKNAKYGLGKEGNLEEEMVLEVDVGGRVEDIIEEVVSGVRNVMSA